MTSVTPIPDALQNMNFTSSPGAARAVTSSNQVKVTGTVVDLSGYTWSMQARPQSSANMLAPTYVPTGLTVTGSSTGYITVADDGTEAAVGPPVTQMNLSVIGKASGATNEVLFASLTWSIANQ